MIEHALPILACCSAFAVALIAVFRLAGRIADGEDAAELERQRQRDAEYPDIFTTPPN